MKLTRFLKSIFLVLGTASFFAQNAYAQLNTGPGPARLQLLNDIFGHIIFDLVIPAFALAFFVMVVIAGFRFLTSGGEPKAVASARDTLTYAVCGVILMIVAILLLIFIEEFTGAEITRFKITFPTVNP